MNNAKVIPPNPRVNNPAHLDNQRFFEWCSNKLPSSKFSFGLTDIDICIYDRYKRRFMLIEVKCYRRECKPAQRDFFHMLCRRLKHIETLYQDNPDLTDNWKYQGFVFVQFGKGIFDGSGIYVNRNPVTEKELIKILRFEIPPPPPPERIVPQ